ncbi:6-bladed beta-propeller [Lewinella lacunae]|uniref:6-bladed beta-propeller n=2 Tax=Neolewinella lacunae TaxID=1517758 RepID=A0A923T8D3_9BACT|nr:6-bladed beta-propeller [Neolewinella lacunae]MBC6994451.1 6-bladed beta-propeller [Neolewinella lacunae]
MNPHRIAFYILALLYLNSCSEDVSPSEDMKNFTQININEIEEVTLPNLIKDVTFTQLELTNASGMTSGSKILIRNNKFYILDPAQNEVFIFNIDGSFVDKISSLGDAPNQISFLVDFAFNDYTNEIELLDPRGKIISYRESDRSYRNVLNAQDQLTPVYGFALMSEDNIAFYSNLKEYLVYFYSRSRKEITSSNVLNEAIEPIDWHSIHPFSQRDNETFLLDMYLSKVYTIDSNGVHTKHTYNFGDNDFNISSKTHSEISAAGDLFGLLAEKKAFYPLSFHFEDDDFIVLRGLHEGTKRKELVFRKKSNLWTITDVTNDFNFYLCKASLRDGRYVGIQNVPGNIIKQFSDADLNANQKEALNGIKEDGNPVLVFYNFN